MADRLVADARGEELTRALSRWAMTAVALSAAAAVLPGSPRPEAPLVVGTVMLLLLGALMVTTGVYGPMASRLTSALAIAALGILVVLVADLPSAAILDMTGVFVRSPLAPTVPVMLLGQVWLYRMPRRSAGAETFFA